MKKNGFTLIELIVTIALLAIIGVAIGISLNRTIKAQRETDKKDYINKVISAANLYATNNKEILDSLYTNKGYVLIKMGDIIDAGLISKNTINPETKGNISRDDEVKALLDARGSLIIEYPVSVPEEDYLRAMDIVVEYEDNSITDYCYYKINEPELAYITSTGNIKNGYLVPNSTIKCENISIDTSKLGTYELIYDYLLESGAWKKGTRKVVVSDNTPPTCGNVTGAGTTWVKTPRTITVGCLDNYKCANASETKTLSNMQTGSITIEDATSHSTGCTVNVYSDTVLPTGVTISAPDGLTATKTLTGRGTDALSGIKYYQFSTNSSLTDISSTGTSITPTTEQITEQEIVTVSGTYYFYVQDQAGNIKRSTTGVTVGIDNESPYIELTVDDGTTYAKSKTGTVTIKDDGSGLTANAIKIYYKWSTSAVTCSNIGTNYITITPTAGAKTASGTITRSTGTGAGKLYICNKEAINDVGGTSLSSTLVSANMYLDNTAPTTPDMHFVFGDWSVYSSGWTNKNLHAGWADGDRTPQSTDAHSGIAEYQISTDNSTWVDFNYDYTNSLYKMSTSNTHNRYFKAIDNAGNESGVKQVTGYLDKDKPSITFSASESTSWSKSKSVVVTIKDAVSGLKSGGTVKYGWSDSNTTAPGTSALTSATITYTNGTTGDVTFTASGSGISGKKYLWVVPTIQDQAGNSATNTVSTGQFWFDNTKPTTPDMHFVFGDWSVFEGTWTNKNLHAGWASDDRTPQSTDAHSGIAKYQISTDNSAWVDFDYDYTKDLYKMQTEGPHTRYFRAVDNVGLISDVKTVTGKIDKTDPTITITPAATSTSASSIKVRIKATDSGGSELNTSSLVYSKGSSISGSGTSFTNDTEVTISLSAGANYVTARACDNAGNCTTQKSPAYTRTTTTTTTTTKAPTTTKKKVTINFDKNFFDKNLITKQFQDYKVNWVSAYESKGTDTISDVYAIGGYTFILNMATVYYGVNKAGFNLSGMPTLTKDKTYTYSYYVRHQNPDSSRVDTYESAGFEQGGMQETQVKNVWRRIQKTFTATASNSNNNFGFYRDKHESYFYMGFYFRSLELMEGTPTMYSSSQQTVDANLSLPEEPTRAEFSFDGWYTAPVNGTKITSSTKVPNSNTTYYAQWKMDGTSTATETTGGGCSFTHSGAITSGGAQVGTYTSSCTNGTIYERTLKCEKVGQQYYLKKCQNATCRVTSVTGSTNGTPSRSVGTTYTQTKIMDSKYCSAVATTV